jgi:predicted DCC family thiol-disulfide oxidoreductase YuxK
MTNHSIILFDGICNLCNGSVQFVIKHDKDGHFKFAALQTAAGQNLLKKYFLSSTNLDSFVLIENDKAYTQSTAALRVAKKLNGSVKLLAGFMIVPAFIRDAVYNTIARNRYKWFGKKESCMIPTPELNSRFLN